MQIGKLSERITFQQPIRTSDGMGGFTVTWSDVATVWAAVWPISAKEIVKAEKATGEITHRIRIRYRRNIKTSHRIAHGGKYYNIIGPALNAGGTYEWLDLMAQQSGE